VTFAQSLDDRIAQSSNKQHIAHACDMLTATTTTKGQTMTGYLITNLILNLSFFTILGTIWTRDEGTSK